MWIIADEYSTPSTVTFEENVRDHVNQKLRRDAVVGVCRMRSSGIDLLQLADVLLGAVVYDHELAQGLGGYSAKRRLLEYLRERA